MKITHAHLKSWVHSKEFCHSINYAIIAFAVVLGLETFQIGKAWMSFFSILDYLFLLVFTIEILLRIFAEDHPVDFFNLFKTRKIMVAGRKKTQFEITEHGVWNYFDFILILLSIIGVFGNLFVFPGFIQIGRLFRIFRIVRLLEISDHLKEVEKRIVSIIPTVFSFAILLLILTYIYSIMGMFMFDKKIFASCDFSSIQDSFITLFQVMTFGQLVGRNERPENKRSHIFTHIHRRIFCQFCNSYLNHCLQRVHRSDDLASTRQTGKGH
jgi:voltage-gated sodium channel